MTEPVRHTMWTQPVNRFQDDALVHLLIQVQWPHWETLQKLLTMLTTWDPETRWHGIRAADLKEMSEQLLGAAAMLPARYVTAGNAQEADSV